MKNICLLLSMLLLWGACKKVEMPDYTGGPGFYFNALLSDSTNYSFANQLEYKASDTVWLTMQLIGDVTDYERTVELEAAEGSSALEGQHFSLPAVTLVSKAYTLTYPVILLNAPDLKEKTVRLVLKVKENKDFPEGSAIITASRRYTRYKINFNNRLIKPDYWLYIQNYFGEYSDVKYRFMMDVIGISDFLPDHVGGKIPYSDFINYSGQMSNALEAYEAQHGPMLDETGKEINFPL